jgi:hypothetical protein
VLLRFASIVLTLIAGALLAAAAISPAAAQGTGAAPAATGPQYERLGLPDDGKVLYLSDAFLSAYRNAKVSQGRSRFP